jgi:NTP pyrophosphatase (non-canonical NTP hydrolase)
MEHFNQLTPAEAERLALLLEECGEVVHMIGKIQRHGYSSYSPNDPEKRTNRHLLELELGDLTSAIERLTRSKDINERALSWRVVEKTTGCKYLHHQ